MKGLSTKNKFSLYYPLLAGLLLIPLSADAIRMDCSDGLESELPVKVKIEIPAFLYFQVGSVNETPEITFDVTPQLPAQGAYAGAVPPVLPAGGISPVSISGSDVNDGVNVKVRANCGNVRLSYAVSDNQGLSNANGYYVPFNMLKTASTDGGLPAPELENAASGEALVSTTAYGAVTDRSATWKYTYHNTAVPVSGEYRGTVTYQASCI